MKIQDIELNDSHIGRVVLYNNNEDRGTIRSWNAKFVFVEYPTSPGRGIATSPRDLTFE